MSTRYLKPLAALLIASCAAAVILARRDLATWLEASLPFDSSHTGTLRGSQPGDYPDLLDDPDATDSPGALENSSDPARAGSKALKPLVSVWSPEKTQWREKHCKPPKRSYARNRNRAMDLPDFFLAGTQKGGTSAAGRNLFTHPDVYLPRNEFHIFSSAEQRAKGRAYYNQQMLSRSDYTGQPIVGEKAPGYMYDRDAPAEMKKFAPNSKIIVILREPFRRAYSAYIMAVEFGFENRTFLVAATEEMEYIERARLDPKHPTYLGLGVHDRRSEGAMIPYLRRGFYHVQIQNMLKSYDECDLFVAVSERVYAQRIVEYDAMLNFLGARGTIAGGKPLKDYNVRAGAPVVGAPSGSSSNSTTTATTTPATSSPPKVVKNAWNSPEMRKLAKEVRARVFEPENKKLFAFLGRSIPEWSEEFD